MNMKDDFRQTGTLAIHYDTAAERRRAIGILEAKGLPTAVDATAEDILEFATRDKKRQSGAVTVVVPDRIGHARLERLDMGRFRQYVEAGLP